MSADNSDEPTITVSVRDMLREFKDDFRADVKDLEKSVAAGFARLEKGQETKADKSDIVRLEEKIKGHQDELLAHAGRIEEIERKQAADETAVATKEKDAAQRQGKLARVYTFAGVVATGATGWFTYLLTHHH
jgi:hypothetical protein